MLRDILEGEMVKKKWRNEIFASNNKEDGIWKFLKSRRVGMEFS